MLLVCFVDWSLDDQHCVLCPHACAARLCTFGGVVAAQQHVQRAHSGDCRRSSMACNAVLMRLSCDQRW